MTKWEYKVRNAMIRKGGQLVIDEDILARYGLKGWELTAIAPNGYAVFKRHKHDA
jgi:hypothetical protein